MDLETGRIGFKSVLGYGNFMGDLRGTVTIPQLDLLCRVIVKEMAGRNIVHHPDLLGRLILKMKSKYAFGLWLTWSLFR